jgi:outer membrane protein TolC
LELRALERAGRSFSAGSTFALLAACASTVRAPDAGAEVSRAVGVAGAIELRVAGDPIDVPGTTAGPLALASALRLALERDARLQAALARVRVALADAQQARWLPNPIVSLVLRVPEGGGRPEVEAGVTAEVASILKRPRRVEAADKRLRASVADAVTVALDVVATLREQYASAQAFDELLSLLRERAALLDRLLEVARSRLELGEATRVEVTTIQTQRVELDIEVADLELRRRRARLGLARAIGQPAAAAEWQLDAWAPLPAQVPGEQAWIAAALRRRPEIQSSVLELAALGDEAAIAALAHWDGTALGLAAERTADLAAGPELALPIPLFDVGAARRARASALVVAARHELVDLSRGIVEEVRRALASFAVASRSLARVRDELIPLQRQRREEVEAIFLAGQTDVTTLLLAERDLQATQSKLVELEERAAASLAQLERAVGGSASARDVESQPRP